MQKPVEKIVVETLAEMSGFEVSQILPDTKLVDLGIESVKLVETVFLLEDALDISIPYSQSREEPEFDATSVGTLIASLENLVRANA